MDKLSAVLALHNPEAWKEDMVYSVWEDGEITLEAGGELFGQWICLTVEPEAYNYKHWLPPTSLPITNSTMTHSRILVESLEDADKARNLIIEKS